jgi:cob(I)alamin adenosyltransferase
MKLMKKLGLLQVYTGDGKGKTTASLGLALRAIGHGMKVCMIQFMKNSDIYGEVRLAEKMPGLTIIPVGRHDFVNLKNPAAVDIELAGSGWDKAREIILSQQYDIVILDEINVALSCGLLDPAAVIPFLSTSKGATEVVATGCWAPQALLDAADLVTEMKNVRHPYSKGVESREGIDH